MEAVDKLVRAYRLFFYLFLGTAIIINILDIIRLSDDDLTIFINSMSIFLMIVTFVLYRRMAINIKLAVLLTIGILLINIYFSLYYFNPEIELIDYSTKFLKNSLIILFLITAAIIVNKYVSYGLTLFYILFYIVSSHKFNSSYLIENTIPISISFIAYTVILLFITNLLQRLILELDKSNTRIISQNFELEDQKNRIEIANEELIEKNNELIESRNKFKNLNETKEQIIEIISHDLRNPFNSIIGFFEILKLKGGEPNSQLVDQIHNTSIYTHRLLENLFVWARKQTGKIQYLPKEFSLNDLVSNEIELQKIQCTNKGVQLIFKNQTNYMVIADPDLISIVIRNLISNAIKFSNKNGIIHISLTKINNGNQDQIQFKIEDDGTGMSEERIDQILYEEKITSMVGTDNEKGTGIGLTICRSFLELNKSVLHIESKKNIGSKFFFYLPIHDSN